MSKIPYMIIVGENEEKDGTISVRKHGEGDKGTFTIDDFISLIEEEINSVLEQF